MTVRLLIAVLFVTLPGAAALAAPRAAPPIDVEIAIDTTGSMGPSIRRAQRSAGKLVRAIKKAAPRARFAVVQFKDAGDTPEYELLQPMSGSAKAVEDALSRVGPGGGGDNPEAYNAVFRNSYADKRTGWRAKSRKLVVVIGDAEPHGAGAAGFSGCVDASADPHALRTRQELIGMKANERTLIMIRQASTATVSLQCYKALAAATYSGWAARDGGSNIAGVIEALVRRAARIKPGPASRASRPKTRSGADRTPPQVQALKSGGYSGTTIRLLYRVRDDSGRSSERVAVYVGNRVLTQSRWAPFGPSNGKAYYFDFPAPTGMSGNYRFCVQSRDPSGNVSKPSCNILVLN